MSISGKMSNSEYAKNCKNEQNNQQKRQKNAKNGKNSKINDAITALNDDEKTVVINEQERMRIWVKTLLSIYGTIPNIIKIIDKIIVGQASNPFATNYGTNSYDQIEKVIDYVDRKNKLTNINLMTQKLIDAATEDEQELIEMKFGERQTANQIADYLNLDVRSVFRKIEKIIARLADIALIKGWTNKFVSYQLEDEAWVIERYNEFYKEFLARKQKLNNK